MAQLNSIQSKVQRCPTLETLSDFNVGKVTLDELDAIASHLGTCTTCEQIVESICHQADPLVSEVRDDETRGGQADEPTPRVDEVVRAIRHVPEEFDADADGSVSAEPRTLREYELLEKLGQGGMGAVYKARHSRLDKTVAVKLLSRERLGSEQAVERFRREMKAIGALDHPNIVRALDAGEVEGTHFLVMEYVEGTNLSKLVRERGALPIEEACDYIRQAAIGLQHVHDHGLIHRDIKPSNLIVDSRGSRVESQKSTTAGRESYDTGPTVKILDLGLALLGDTAKEKTASDDHDLTQADQLIGTFDYIAPEQAKKSHEVDSRADIYGLGCTLYCLLAGRAPFSEHSVVEKLAAHQLEVPESLSKLRDDVPAELEAIVDKMLAKSPDERFQSPMEVAEAVRGLSLRESAHFRGAKSHATARRTPIFISLAVVVLALFGYFFGATVVRIATNKGQLVIKTDAEDIEVVVKDQVGKIIDRKTGREITLAAGDYEIEVTIKDAGGETKFFTKKLSIKRGGREIITAELELAKVGPDRRAGPGSRASPGHQDGLGSPSYKLDPGAIPNEERFSWQPKELVAVLGEHRGRRWGSITDAALSPDGKTIATCGLDPAVRLWDAVTLREKVVLPHAGWQQSLAYSPDGGLLVVGDKAGKLTGWDVHGDGPKQVFQQRDLGSVLTIAFSRDGGRLAVGCSRKLLLFAVNDNSLKRLAEVESEPLLDVTFDAAGDRLFTSHRDGTIGVWDIRDVRNAQLKPTRSLAGHANRVQCLALSPDGRTLASGSHDLTVRLWDLDEPANDPLVLRHPKGAEVESLAFSGDGRTLASGSMNEGQVYLWNVPDLTSQPRLIRFGANAAITALSFTADDATLVTTDSHGAVRLWDVSGDEPLERIKSPSHQGPVVSLSLMPDGKTLVSSSGDDRVRLWDFDTRPIAASTGFDGGTARIKTAALSADGGTLAIAGSGPRHSYDILLWDLTGSEPAQRGALKGHTGQINGLAFSSNGRWLASASGRDETARLWRVEDERVSAWTVLDDQQGDVLDVAFSPDSSLFATAGEDKNVHLWRLDGDDEPVEVSTLPHDGEVCAIAFSPDGAQLAAATRSRSAVVWDISAAKPQQTAVFRPRPSRPITSDKNPLGNHALAFAPDGKTLAYTTGGYVYLWDPGSDEARQSWKLPGEVYSLLFTHDARHLLTGNANGTIYVLKWPFAPRTSE